MIQKPVATPGPGCIPVAADLAPGPIVRLSRITMQCMALPYTIILGSVGMVAIATVC